MTLTRLMVGLFLVVLLIAAGSAYAEGGAKIAIGQTRINSHESMGEIGYERNDWEVNLGVIGQGYADDQVVTYGISKIVRPHWKLLGGTN